MERCPACRARLADAALCPRCGTDFSISRRAEHQALGLSRLAVRELARGKLRHAVAAAEAASDLASPVLASVLLRMLERRNHTMAATDHDADDSLASGKG